MASAVYHEGLVPLLSTSAILYICGQADIDQTAAPCFGVYSLRLHILTSPYIRVWASSALFSPATLPEKALVNMNSIYAS